MSDINLEFTVSNNSIEFTVDPIDLTFTPEDIQLQFFTGSSPTPGGTSGELQYNNNGILDGVPNTLYDGSNLTLGNVANIKILGGVNGYVLQTDGTGNLDWAAMGGGGNGTPGGSNTQIQYNDNGTFGGNTGFTFNEVSGNVAIPGNLSVVGNIFGNSQTAYLANFATVANSVAAANVIGQVANALVAGTVYTGAQPNITSVGNLSNLTVIGNMTTANLTVSKITNIVAGIENLNIVGTQIGTYDLDILTSPITYSSGNANANITLNIRGNSTVTLNSLISNNQSITVSYVMTNGSTPYGISNLTIDGSSANIKYVGSTAIVPNSISAYTYTLIKNNGNFTVLGSLSRYL